MTLAKECRKELENNILPFWKKLRDDENGGYYGYMDFDLKLDKKAPKGVILNSRILWFFSNCYLVIGGEDNLDHARHAFEFLKNKCLDREHGGVYWMLDWQGNVLDDMKHTYNQAFAIYALASYYDASGDEEALSLAFELFDTIESKTLDEYGYQEAFSREWELIQNDALSENGIIAEKTMNAILHLIEGYTELLRVKRDQKVKARLEALIKSVDEKVYYPDEHRLLVFFDRKLQVLGDIHSYGHDIEASWLTDRACEVLGDLELEEKMNKIDLEIAENIYNIAFDGKALRNERDKDFINTVRIWWVQAESVVGFVNAYQQSGDRKYLDTAKTIFEYIKNYVCDKREGGEWYWCVDENGVPSDKPIVEPWKCPYHNGRMCLEMIKRKADF
ncbi:MAG: AGE family epimerase/isomerase [Oscillospiraceae bacterium]